MPDLLTSSELPSGSSRKTNSGFWPLASGRSANAKASLMARSIWFLDLQQKAAQLDVILSIFNLFRHVGRTLVTALSIATTVFSIYKLGGFKTLYASSKSGSIETSAVSES
jgi:hypothetical protein